MDIDMDRDKVILGGGIVVLALGLVLLWSAVQDLSAETDELRNEITGLQAEVTDLRVARACDTVAEQLNDRYCDQYVANPETIDEATERCRDFQSEQNALYQETAATAGCTIDPSLDTVGELVTEDGRVPVDVQGETVDCVEAGYITLDCPA